MILRHLKFPFWIALLLGTTTVLAADSEYVKIATTLIDHINAEDYDKIHQMLSSTLRGAFPEAKAKPYFRSIIAARGKLLRVKDSVVGARGAGILVDAERGQWNLTLMLDRKSQIASLNFTPVGALIALPERNKTPMRLPVNGEWYVTSGGATAQLNRHFNSRSQRMALDMEVRDAQGKAFAGDGKDNADYYAFGMDILAPADGSVVLAVDGAPDSKPGLANGFFGAGNCIVLKHSDSEFSVFSHLMAGSLCARVGDTVKAGQVIGKCGNSGNSNEPHVQFHLQNLADISEASGFEAYFQNIRVTRDLRARVERDYAPIRGDSVVQLVVETPVKPAK